MQPQNRTQSHSVYLLLNPHDQLLTTYNKSRTTSALKSTTGLATISERNFIPNSTPLHHRTQMEWVFLRFQLASFMPWSDVRRIPHVRVGGFSIHITESLSSSKGRKNSMSTTSLGGSSGSAKSAGNGIDHDGQPSVLSSSTSSGQQSSQHLDRKDSWEHQGRRASLSRPYSASSDGSGGTDGYELERVAQATLEHALGREFTAKYQVK